MAFSSLKHLQHMYTRIINASVFLTWIGIISAKLLIFSSISPSRYQSIFSGTDRDAGAPAKKSGFRRISAVQFPSRAFFFSGCALDRCSLRPRPKLSAIHRTQFSPETVQPSKRAKRPQNQPQPSSGLPLFSFSVVHDGASRNCFPPVCALGRRGQARRARAELDCCAPGRCPCSRSSLIHQSLQGRVQGQQDPGLQQVHVQGQRDLQQALLVLHGRHNGSHHRRRSQEHCSRWVWMLIAFVCGRRGGIYLEELGIFGELP